jgi:hypothetical protein
MGFSLSAKAAVYIAAFAPEIAATDPHIAINGGTNWFAPWYLDWERLVPDIPTHTVLSMLNPDPAHPGFEHDLSVVKIPSVRGISNLQRVVNLTSIC